MTGAGDLVEFIAAELAQPVSPEAHALADRVREIYGDQVRAILFYGSCLRKGSDPDSVLDLYVLVDRYRSVYQNPLLVVANTILPPNVFYLEAECLGRVVRSKYAVLSRSDLLRSTLSATFEPYFWARFAQPCALVYAVDQAVADEVAGALAQAVRSFFLSGVSSLRERFRASELWMSTLGQTYRCEVRAERAAAPDALYLAAPERYDEVARLGLPLLPYPVAAETGSDGLIWTVELPAWKRRVAPCVWGLRRLHGKIRFLLRLLRNGLIFEGGVDYVLWKIERHSGVKADPSWREKRFRWMALVAEIWRLHRRGAFR